MALSPTAPTRPAPAKSKIRPDFSGQRLRLAAQPIPGYHLCWVNDSPGNVSQFQLNGYQFVEMFEQSSDGGTVSGRDDSDHRASDQGSHVRAIVGTAEGGGPLYAYLMKIEDLLFDEGMRTIESRNNAVREAIYRTVREGKVQGIEQRNSYARAENVIRQNNSKVN